MHFPVPGQPHHLVRSVQEIWQAMEPLITFKEGEVFTTMALSKWTEITSPQSMEAVPQESPKSHTQSSQAHLRGSLSANCSKGWPATTAMQGTAKAEALTTPSWEFMTHQPSSDPWPLYLLPRLTEIAQTLWREEPMESSPLPVIAGILSKEAIDP